MYSIFILFDLIGKGELLGMIRTAKSYASFLFTLKYMYQRMTKTKRISQTKSTGKAKKWIVLTYTGPLSDRLRVTVAVYIPKRNFSEKRIWEVDPSFSEVTLTPDAAVFPKVRLVPARIIEEGIGSFPTVCPKIFFIRIIPLGIIKCVPSSETDKVNGTGPVSEKNGAANV